MSVAYRLAKPLLFRMDPEQAHTLSIRALKTGLMPRIEVPTDPRLKVELAGLSFPNPLGLAAGYDKNARIIGPLTRMPMPELLAFTRMTGDLVKAMRGCICTTWPIWCRGGRC